MEWEIIRISIITADTKYLFLTLHLGTKMRWSSRGFRDQDSLADAQSRICNQDSSPEKLDAQQKKILHP
jgi:hypothetical protein